MNQCVFRYFIVFICSFIFLPFAFAETKPPAEGGSLPEIILSVPENPRDQQYLGLSEDGKFAISKIKAEVVIIQIFSMYCPHCQADAPRVNQLFKKITANDPLKDKIKLIGIAIGNSAFETSHFENTYKVEFPLFPDGDYAIHKKLGDVRTPYYIGVKLNKGKKPRVFYSKAGGVMDVDQFLEAILNKSGLKK
ncbi:MAG TPA: redoxin domain-containing protein [Flexilinea sp.]|nr:redoxin domain-containing protein [Flexilinea sp.]